MRHLGNTRGQPMRLVTLTITLPLAAATCPAQSPPSTTPAPRRPILANTRLGELLPLPLTLPASRTPKTIEQLPPPAPERPPAFSPYSVIRYDGSPAPAATPTSQSPYEYSTPTLPYRSPNRGSRQRPQYLPPPTPEVFSKGPAAST